MTTVAVGSVPVSGIPWLGVAAGALLGMYGVYGFAKLKKGLSMKMSDMEITLRTLVMQLIDHIEKLEIHNETLAKRPTTEDYEIVRKANAGYLEMNTTLQRTNETLSRENAELRKRAADAETLARDLGERVRELQDAKARKRR